MKVKGIKRGQTIELLEEVVSISDGAEVVVEVSEVHPLSQLSLEERSARINTVLGGWKDQPDLIEIFAEINRERHADLGRDVDFSSFDK